MRKTGTKALLIALLVVVTFTGTASAGWWDGVGDAETIDLKDVIESPRKWKGKEVVFDCYFHETSDFYNPYYTRFLPAQYVNFSVWPEGARLWNKEEYSNSFHFLFIEKDHKRFGHLVGMKKFTHLRLRGYVQNTFKNVPWIEIRGVEVLGNAITRDSLREVILGDRAADREEWDVALEHYARAAAATLPGEVMAGIEKKRGHVYEGLRDYVAAMAAYELARKLDLDDEETHDLLVAVAKKLGRPIPELPAAKPAEQEKAGVMVEARPVDEGRYPPTPMAMPAPVNVPDATPAESPVKMDEPIAPARPEQPQPATPTQMEPPAPAEADPLPQVEEPETPLPQVEEPETPPAPIRIKKTPKKRMSGPV